MKHFPFCTPSRDVTQLWVGLGLYSLLVVTALVYWPGLEGGFLLDDLENLKPFEDLEKGLLNWREAVFSNSSSSVGRPLAMLTFAANVAVSGLDTWALKYTNVMIHLLCGVLVFWLAARLLRESLQARLRPGSWALALVVAALWLLAPLLVSTTLYIIQRLAQLATLFSLAGLLGFTIGRQNLETRPHLGWSLIASSFVAWLPLAILSKENGVLLPLLMLMIEIFVFRFRGTERTKHVLYAIFSISVLLPAIAGLLMIVTTHAHLLNYNARPYTLIERLLTETRALFYYIGNLLIPQGSGMGLYHDDFPISRGLLKPVSTLAAVMGWAVFAILVYVSRRRVWWPLLLGPCFFLAGHTLESSIFPLEPVFEHRNYLPAFGIIFTLVLGLWLLADKIKKPTPIVLLFVLLPAVYGFATYQRTTTWSSRLNTLLTAEETHPSSVRVHIDLANVYSASGELETSLKHLEQVKRLRKSAALAADLHSLLVYCNTDHQIPIDLYNRLPNEMPRDDSSIYTINVFRSLANNVVNRKCPELDIKRLIVHMEQLIVRSRAVGATSGLWDLHYHTAYLYRATGQAQSAIRHLREANTLDPSRPEALLTMMQYQLSVRDYTGGRQTLATLRERFPNPAPRHAGLIKQFTMIMNTIEKNQTRTHHATVN